MAQAPEEAIPVLFDRALLRRRQARATQLGAATFLLDRVVDDLRERLHAVLRNFSAAADIGSPGDALVEALRGRIDALTHVDLVGAEHERLALGPETLDLAVSALALQFVNDLPGVLAQIRRALKPDG